MGVSGLTADVRTLLEAAGRGNGRAQLALEMFADRAAAGIAAVATALPSIDGIVFTGGIGEHAGVVRSTIAERLSVLGVRQVEAAETGEDRILRSRDRGGSGDISLLRIEAREDVVAARAALGFL